ncbi:MAG: nucleotidyltransferase family protein [bacterium]|nr:nucleotidyltransferase family protein [bacterium]
MSNIVRATRQDRTKINLSTQEIAEFCQKNNIRKLSVFGSVLRDDFGPESDVDVLVEFGPGEVVGFFRLASMELELSEILGHKVDLRTPAELSRYFRKEVINQSKVQYAKG